MTLFKKISIRLTLLLVMVFVFNYIYKITFYKTDLENNGTLIQKLKFGIKNSDILFFSASPNRAHPLKENDKRSISKIIDDYLPNHTVTAVDTGAIHAGVFKKIIQMIPNENNIEYLVVNMNYRSFGMGWIMSNLENSLAKQSVFYSNKPVILNRFLQGLNYYDALSESERNQQMISSWKNSILPFKSPKNTVDNWCKVEKWGDWRNPKRNLADHYIKNYAFVLDNDNVRVKDFDEIVEICNSKKIKLIFNILAENIEKASYLVDSDLISLIEQNKNFLIKRYSKKGVFMVDNLSLVSDSCFYEKNFPTEHYTFEGREIVAKNVAKVILGLEKR